MAASDTPPNALAGLPTTESSAASAPPSVAETWRPAFNPWLIAVVVALAAFMGVLDTSIANVALPYPAGALGALSVSAALMFLLSFALKKNAPGGRHVAVE
jgi:hypothetical protein